MPGIPARRSRREVLRMGAGAVGAALLAACGRDDERPLTADGTAHASALSLRDSYPAPEGIAGGLLHLAASTAEARAATWHSLVYSQLVAVDPRTALVYQDLAEGVEMPEQLRVVFKLRQELRFHPDAAGLAAALTAEDVRRDFGRRRGAREHLFAEAVERVEAVDQLTLVLHMRGPFSTLFEALGDPATGAVRASESYGWSEERRGGGALIPLADVQGTTAPATLARNQLYHRRGLPFLDGVELTLPPDEQALAAAFARGEVDVRPGAQPSSDEGSPEALVLERPGFGLVGVGLSLLPEKGGRPVRSVEAFQDARVRRAVAVALDRPALLAGLDAVTSGPVGPAHAADALSERELGEHPLYRHDPAEARALLAAAGLPDLAFTLQVMARPHLAALAEIAIAQWRAVGIDAQVQSLEPKQWEQAFGAGDFEATLFELDGFRSPTLGLQIHTSSGIEDNFSPWGYSDPVYDVAVRGVLNEQDPEARAARSHEAQRLLLDETPAMFPLAAPLERVTIARRVRGYEFAGYGFNDAWLAPMWHVSG